MHLLYMFFFCYIYVIRYKYHTLIHQFLFSIVEPWCIFIALNKSTHTIYTHPCLHFNINKVTGIYFKFQYKLSSTFFLLNAQAHTNKEQVKGRDLYVNSSQCSVNIQDDCHINVVGLLFRQNLSS